MRYFRSWQDLSQESRHGKLATGWIKMIIFIWYFLSDCTFKKWFITYNFSKEHFAKVHRRTLLTFSIWSAAVIFSVWCSFNRIIDILITYVAERNVLTSTSFLAQSCQTNLTLIMVNLLQRLMWNICESYEFFTLKCRGLSAARTSIIKHVSYGWYLV